MAKISEGTMIPFPSLLNPCILGSISIQNASFSNSTLFDKGNAQLLMKNQNLSKMIFLKQAVQNAKNKADIATTALGLSHRSKVNYY